MSSFMLNNLYKALCSKYVQSVFKIDLPKQTFKRNKSTMEALVFDGEAMSVTHRTDYPMPKILKDDDVIVKIEYAGICGTDLHIIKGEFPARKSPPLPLGHESSGVVASVGKCSVFKPGQKVAIYPCSPCNLCEFCRLGIYQHCQVSGLNSYIGIARDGGWAQYCRVPQDLIYELPEGVTTKQAALAEPYSCVVHTFRRAAPLRIGQKILVIGAGIIGNLFTAAFHHHGHRDVTVCEINKNRLELIKNLETGYRLIEPSALEKDKIHYDLMIDCTGVGKVFETCLKYMRYGGKYVLFGCCPPTHTAIVNPSQIFDRELTIVAAKTNPFTFYTSMDWMKAMGDRYTNYDRLGVKIYRLSDYKTAFADLRAGHAAKGVFLIE